MSTVTNHSRSHAYVIVTLLALTVSLVIFFGASEIKNIYFDQYSNACWKLASLSESFNVPDCVIYLNENPKSTGLQVLDHFESTYGDKLLTKHGNFLNNIIKPERSLINTFNI